MTTLFYNNNQLVNFISDSAKHVLLRQLKTVLSVTLVWIFIASCQKTSDAPDVENPPIEVTSKIPTRIKVHYFADDYVEDCAIQYDTANRAIRIFSDDPATSNPYDVLLAQYEYNEAGYLVKLNTIYDGQDQSTNIIVRDANNQVKYITELDSYISEADTTFFTYSQTAAGYEVETNYRYPDGIQPATSHKKFTYSNQWQLLKTEQLVDNPYTINYQYSQNLFTGYGLYKDGTVSESIGLEYNSGLPVGEADPLLRLLCGKDFYLLQVKGLNYFRLFRDEDYLHLSMTDPAHPTRLLLNGLDENLAPVTQAIGYTYQVNTAGQVTRIAVDHEYDSSEILFTY